MWQSAWQEIKRSFIDKKKLTEIRECKYIRPEKLGLVKRIEGQTAKQTIKTLKEIWLTHPIPEIFAKRFD